jgi:DNA-binding response OmpR family regulator
MAPLRVLIIEDDPAVAELVVLGLGREYMCEQAAEARTALRLAAHTPPAAVILDLRLRGGDGLDLLAALRRLPALARVPVVIFSSSADQPAVARRLAALPAAGPIARVPKAAGVRGLRTALAELLREA